MRNKHRNRCSVTALALALLASVNASAGTFSSNFNSLQFDPNDSGNSPKNGAANSFLPPTGMIWGGSLRQGIAGGYDMRTGGVSGSGVLKIVDAVGSQQSSVVVG